MRTKIQDTMSERFFKRKWTPLDEQRKWTPLDGQSFRTDPVITHKKALALISMFNPKKFF